MKHSSAVRAAAIAFLILTAVLLASCNDRTSDGVSDGNDTTAAYGEPPAWAQSFQLNNPGGEATTSSEYGEFVETSGDLRADSEEGAFGNVAELTVTAADNDGVEYDIYSYRDNSTKTLYLFLPCTADITNVTFTARHQNGTITGPYRHDFSSGKLKTYVSDKEYSVKAMQSKIPTLYLQIDEDEGSIKSMNRDSTHETYCYGELRLAVTEELAKEKGWVKLYKSYDVEAERPCSMEMRGRGNWTWNQEKKPYQIRTENKIDLLGMGSAKRWILLANVMDASLMRDQLFYDLGKAMGLDYSPDIQPVDVFMNGKYLGSYSLCEKVEVDESRVNISETDDYLLEVDHYYYNETYTFMTEHDVPLTMHNNEDFKLMNKINGIIDHIEDAIYDEDSDKFAELLDIDSWVKYYWLQDLSRNNDTMIGSCYMYYVSSEKKLYAGPVWDMDNTLGIWGGGKNLMRKGWHSEEAKWFRKMILHDEFRDAVDKYYLTGGLREIFDALAGKIDEYEAYVTESAEMNYIVNDCNHYVPLDTVTYADEVDYLREFLEDRLEFYRSEYGK